MEIVRTPIPGLLELRATVHRDGRGFFLESWRDSWRAELGCGAFVQDNHSCTPEVGVVRGLHFQRKPNAHGKLVRAARGRVFDVAVDLREGSPTFGSWHAVELSSEEQNMLWVPEGFAHGLMTLEPESHVTYKLTDYYAPESEGGVRWDDPAIGIEWPMEPTKVSAKDRTWPELHDIPALG